MSSAVPFYFRHPRRLFLRYFSSIYFIYFLFLNYAHFILQDIPRRRYTTRVNRFNFLPEKSIYLYQICRTAAGRVPAPTISIFYFLRFCFDGRCRSTAHRGDAPRKRKTALTNNSPTETILTRLLRTQQLFLVAASHYMFPALIFFSNKTFATAKTNINEQIICENNTYKMWLK